MPDPETFPYTFDETSEIIESFLEKLGFRRFGLYVQDYGGPVGFRILSRRPDWLEWLIIQNTDAYEWGSQRCGMACAASIGRIGIPTRRRRSQLSCNRRPSRRSIRTVIHGLSSSAWNMDLHSLITALNPYAATPKTGPATIDQASRDRLISRGGTKYCGTSPKPIQATIVATTEVMTAGPKALGAVPSRTSRMKTAPVSGTL